MPRSRRLANSRERARYPARCGSAARLPRPRLRLDEHGFEGYDSRADGRARFMPHTGFVNPACPSEFVPRESIEARTLVVFDEPA